MRWLDWRIFQYYLKSIGHFSIVWKLSQVQVVAAPDFGSGAEDDDQKQSALASEAGAICCHARVWRSAGKLDL